MKFNVTRGPYGLHYWFVVLPSGNAFVSQTGYHDAATARDVAERVYRYEFDEGLAWRKEFEKAFG